MARLSLGQATGEVVGAKESRRLVGAEPQVATGGAIAPQMLAAPALRPQAQAANLYFQPGAPTLGGPVQLGALPSLPEPSQDMAALAKALGNFSPELSQLVQTTVDFKKAEVKQREAEATKFAAEVSQFGAYGSKPELQKNLERAAASGNEDAKRLLQYMLSRHPGMMTYVDEAVSESAFLTRIAKLPSVMKEMRMIDDGQGGQVDIRTLRSSDPRYQAAVNANLLGGLDFSPRSYTKYQTAIANAQAQEYKRQDDAFYVRQREDQYVADTVQFDAMAQAAGNGTITAGEIGAKLTSIVDSHYQLDEDGGTKFREGLLPRLAAAVAGLPDTTEQERLIKQNAAATILDGLGYAQAGPVEERVADAEGNLKPSSYLVFRLGGRSVYNTFQKQLLDVVNGVQSAEDTYARNEGQRYAGALGETLFTPEVAKNPAQLDRNLAQGLQLIAERFAGNPEAAAGARATLQATYSTYEKAYSDPLRQQLFQQHQDALIAAAGDPRQLAIVEARIREAARTDPGYASKSSGLLTQIATRLTTQNQPLFTQGAALTKAALKKWDDYSRDTSSYGGGAVTQQETALRATAQRRMREKVNEIIQKGRAAGKTNDEIDEDLRNAFNSSNFGLQRKPVDPASITRYRSLSEANKGISWFDFGAYDPNRKSNQDLKRDVRERIVTSKSELMTHLDDLLLGRPMNDDLKKVLKRTGMNISDYFMYQMKLQTETKNGTTRNLWDTLDPSVKQQIRGLDAKKKQLLSQADVDNQPASQSVALAPMQLRAQSLADLALNIVAPPAQAMELGDQLAAQLEAQNRYSDVASLTPYVGVAGERRNKGSWQNAMDAVTRAGASPLGFATNNSNDIQLVSKFYRANPGVANQYDLATNLFVRYTSGLGSKGLQVSQEQGKSIFDAYLSAKQRLADPAFQRELRSTRGPGYISQLSQDLREGRVPVRYDYGDATAEVKSSVGQFYAQEQKDGSILIKEKYNFYYAPQGKEGEDKAGVATREPFLPFTPANIGRNMVRGGIGKPFSYSLRIWPDGRVRVNPR